MTLINKPNETQSTLIENTIINEDKQENLKNKARLNTKKLTQLVTS